MAGAHGSEGRLTVLYDARCRVCTRVAGRLAGTDTERRLRIRPLQLALEDEWAGVRRLRAERDLRGALHVIDESGQWAFGGEAMLRTFERVPLFAPLARLGRLPLVSGMVEPAYRWFERNRARFSWLAGSFRSPQRVGRRQASGPHGRVEAGHRADGDGGDDTTHHGYERDDGHPILG